MVGFQFNNIQLLFKKELIHQLLYENLTQHCVEPDYTNCKIGKFLTNHSLSLFFVMAFILSDFFIYLGLDILSKLFGQFV